jgi:hypothetical protein
LEIIKEGEMSMVTKAHTIRQADMTGECWAVQFEGKEACKKCEFSGTKECGGKAIIKSGKNQKGLKVPIWKNRVVKGVK